MSWIDQPFPPRLTFGIECNPEWESTVVTTNSGRESRNLQWADARHSYDASFAVRTASDHLLIREHFHMARGRVNTWALLDPLDNSCSVAQGTVGFRDSDSLQLMKRYGTGDYAYDRKITRPFDVSIYVDDVLQTITIDYDLDEDTGALTIDADAEDITWSGSFYVPCRYDVNKLPTRLVSREGGHGEFLVSSESIPIVEVKE